MAGVTIELLRGIMPLFTIKGDSVDPVLLRDFSSEKHLQMLVERNLKAFFNCQFVATEFSTGADHGGRIDTLALSEDGNPVIIEYKKVESSQLINQSLYYLAWIQDHRGDFQVAVNKALGEGIEVDWSDIRVICLAPGFAKYDVHAVRTMGANIELWQYRLYRNDCLYLEEIFSRAKVQGISASDSGKNPIFVAAGKKAAITRQNGVYTFEEHLEDVDENVRKLLLDLREFALSLDDSVEESPKKKYVAYRVAQNFVCMETFKNKLKLYLKLDPKQEMPLPSNARDVSDIGHWGTGDFELIIKSENELEQAKALIKKAFERIGG